MTEWSEDKPIISQELAELRERVVDLSRLCEAQRGLILDLSDRVTALRREMKAGNGEDDEVLVIKYGHKEAPKAYYQSISKVPWYNES